ncbi:ORF6N domain-containing protein [Clostridium estertheticum]|uniref:ORF6N domain-containing protein n=1 Tax=Clostridium estertheticum TaxID=238834 RepID=UPI001C0AAC11|nr:ORF6N domain-containing protein [Clostridium estertheticum]MBU3175911.1 ORF6N domain-containing protein [Clostridium estertheticum]
MDGIAILEFKRQRFLTTEQLADVYGTTINSIKKNLIIIKNILCHKNTIILLKGDESREFKRCVDISDLPINKYSSIYL